ncbi:hypothetical protein KCV07_g6048, partial [Aureobasidium melanogenum]
MYVTQSRHLHHTTFESLPSVLELILDDPPTLESATNALRTADTSSTYGHSQLKTRHPVRSAIHKQLNGRLVLWWVTTGESLLLYVLRFALC